MTRNTGASLWGGGRPAAVVLLLLVLALVAGLGHVLAVPPGQTADEGERIFQQTCAACHTIGQGDLVGPDLKGVATLRDRDWLTRWISAPDRMLAEGDPIATELLKKYNNVPMPNLGLTEAEVASLLAFFEAEAASAPSQETTQAPPGDPAAGDPDAGRNLFTGSTRLTNGAPSCRACHSVAAIGGLGGGTLGPDLTRAYGKFGDAVITWPENVPPMEAIFSSKPLTAEEKADLLAFLESADIAQRAPKAIAELVGTSLGGTVILLGLTHLVWRRRLSKVRRPMVTGQESRDS